MYSRPFWRVGPGQGFTGVDVSFAMLKTANECVINMLSGRRVLCMATKFVLGKLGQVDRLKLQRVLSPEGAI